MSRRRKRKDIDAMPARKTFFDNHLFAEEPTTGSRANVGIKARLLKTCCLGAAASSTKSPMAAKPLVAGGWEDCPAFDLEPLASRQASAVVSVTTQAREPNDFKHSRSASPYYLQPRQVPVGEAEQTPLSSRPGSPARAAAVNALSSPQVPITSLKPTTSVLVPDGLAVDGATCGPRPKPLRPPTPTQDSAADMYNSDNDMLPTAESPLAQSDRQTLQHRVALRLLERRGVLPDGGRSSSSGGNPGSPSLGGGSTSADGWPSSPNPPSPTSPIVAHGNANPGSQALLLVSPNSAPRTVSTEYYSALSSPIVTSNGSPDSGGGHGGGGMAVETVVEVDERLCLQGEEYDPLDVRGDGYRMSAPGGPIPRSVLQSREAWVYKGNNGSGIGIPTSGAAGGERSTTVDGSSAADDLLLRMRGSDFGGTMPGPLCVQARGLRATAGTSNGEMPMGACMGGDGNAPRSAVVFVGSDTNSYDIIGGGSQHRTPPPPAWSAVGGRDELSQEEKEWLFGQPGGMGGLAPVMTLGEGGEGLVDLVRLELPGRTVHLARKATRTSLPAFALSVTGSGPAAKAASMLGLHSQQKVSYRFPFEFFDREVKAMKAVKDSGFVVRFQAAAYDHDAGQGFILMEAAPYGTLEDLHGALCRSQLKPVQRQRPALLQRAIARLNFGNAKSSAPPSLMDASAPSDVATAAATASASNPRPGNLPPHSPAVGGLSTGERPSFPRLAAGGGIGSCGGTVLDVGQTDRERLSCCPYASTVFATPEPATAARAAAAEPGDGDGTSATAMQFAALGSSLMTTRALKYYGACMLQALVALHEAGYVYRDLKMSNVMVCEGGRVRLTDFGAATPSLPDQPGFFGGAAGTRAYLAPEILPWLENGSKRGKRTSGTGGNGGAAGPEPYTITVDSWTWGLMMVELATGWSLKELTQRIIRRVCTPRGPEPPDLPPDCGLPPALRQLLLEHVLVRDPRERWSADRIRTHHFFDGLEWETLAEVEGPHAHLFAKGRLVNTPPPPVSERPDAVAVAMLEGEMIANRRGSRPTGLASPAAIIAARNALANAGIGDGGDTAEAEGTEASVVVPFGPVKMTGLNSGRPSYAGVGAGGGAGMPPDPIDPGLLSPSGMVMSPATGGGNRVPGGRISSLISPVGGAAAAGSGQISGTGLISPLRGAPGPGFQMQSSSGNGPFISPVVLTQPGTPTSPAPGRTSGPLTVGCVSGGGGGSGRRHTLHGTVGSSRLSSGNFRLQTPLTLPQVPQAMLEME